MHCDWRSHWVRLWTYGEEQERDDTMICLISRDNTWNLAFPHERMESGRHLRTFCSCRMRPRMSVMSIMALSVNHQIRMSQHPLPCVLAELAQVILTIACSSLEASITCTVKTINDSARHTKVQSIRRLPIRATKDWDCANLGSELSETRASNEPLVSTTRAL